MDGIEYHITDKTETKYYCNCSRERVERTLITIGKKDLQEILDTDKKAQLTCHFCDGVYDFDEEDLKRLLKELSE